MTKYSPTPELYSREDAPAAVAITPAKVLSVTLAGAKEAATLKVGWIKIP